MTRVILGSVPFASAIASEANRAGKYHWDCPTGLPTLRYLFLDPRGTRAFLVTVVRRTLLLLRVTFEETAHFPYTPFGIVDP